MEEIKEFLIMHELSIVKGIIDIARKELEKADAQTINSIELEIGTLSGIAFDALDFAWKVAIKDTVLAGAEKKIDKIQAKAKCADCGHVFDAESLFDECPKCSSFFTELIRGRELRVKALVVS